MKKVNLVLAICIGGTLVLNAQKLKQSQVPAAVKSAFTKAYPRTVAQWEREDGNYEVVFKKDGKEMSSVIDKSGKLLETETECSLADLPQNIQSYIKINYKNSKIKEAAKIVKASGEVNYEAVVNGKELMFDTNGKLVKKASEKED